MENQERSWNLIRLVGCWSIAAIVFWLCSIYTAAVSIKTICDTYCESCESCSICHAYILIQNIIQVFLCILSLYMIYDWTTIMGYSKHELSNNKHVVLPETKFVILHHYVLPQNSHLSSPLSSVPKVAAEEPFDCTIILLYLVLTKAGVEGSLLVLSLGPWLKSTARPNTLVKVVHNKFW